MQSLNRRLCLFKKTLIPTHPNVKNPKLHSSSSIHRQNDDSNAQKEEKKKKETLYSRISPLGNPKIKVSKVLDQWVEEGRKVRFAELQRIVRDLRKRSRYTQALQISEWTKSQGNFMFSPTEHALQLDLIGKVHGFLSAEKYFNSLSEEERTDKMYGALLHTYVRQRQIDKSLSHLQSMKEKGFSLSYVAYNDIMSLYTKSGEHEKVPDVLAQMKDSGVSPDNLTYRICINSYGQRSDFEGMEKILDDMGRQPGITMDWNTYAVVASFYIQADLKDKASDFLVRAEERLDKNDNSGYNHLISLHAKLGNKFQVFQLWDTEKNNCKRCINRDYMNMLKCLVKLRELEEAEKLLKEWESSGNCYDIRIPNILINEYMEKGLYEKAVVLLKNLMDKGKTPAPETWGRVAAGYLDRGEMDKAVECMKVALSLRGQRKGWKPNPDVVTRLLDFVGEEDTESFVDKKHVVFEKGMNYDVRGALLVSSKDMAKDLENPCLNEELL